MSVLNGFVGMRIHTRSDQRKEDDDQDDHCTDQSTLVFREVAPDILPVGRSLVGLVYELLTTLMSKLEIVIKKFMIVYLAHLLTLLAYSDTRIDDTVKDIDHQHHGDIHN